MKDSKIEWTDHTFNPWIGCQRVSPGCEHCYAEALDKRWGHERWGPKAPRTRTSPSYWKQPIAWNRAAVESGKRARVFCASLADVFEDRAELAPWRAELFVLITLTPMLDWLLLTKRPENIARLWPESVRQDFGIGPERWTNVWLGTTVEDQARANERIPHLLRAPAAVRFLSCEPLLEPIDIVKGMHGGVVVEPATPAGRIDWVIVGGESGPGARPFYLRWADSIRAQCDGAGVAFFMKQVGSLPIEPEADWRGRALTRLLNASTRNRVPEGYVWLKYSGKGDVLEEMPAELRRREFPEVRR